MANKLVYLIIIVGLGLLLIGASTAAARGSGTRQVGPSHPSTIIVRGGSFAGGGPGSGK